MRGALPSPRVALELGRAHSAAGAALAVWVGARLAGADWAPWWLAPMLVAFLLSLAGNAWNDAHDLTQDRINRPRRPLPRGAATPIGARRLAGYCLAGALLVALPFGLWSMLGTLLGIGLLLSYTKQLRAVPLLGNGVVGLLAGMALGYGGLLAGNVPAVLLPAAALTLFFSGRELLKTIHDLPGDRAAGLRTSATEVGPRPTLALATLCWLGGLTLLAAWGITRPLAPWLLPLLALACATLLLPLWRHPHRPTSVAPVLVLSKLGVFFLLLVLLLATRTSL